VGVLVSAAATGLLAGGAVRLVHGNRMAPWILGRAAGLCAYLLLVGLVVFGLVLSHPARTRLRRPSTATRIRIHIALALFTLLATTLHVVVLATDRWAGVGWAGALLPLGASYRPAPVTLGLIGAWVGLLAGLSAALAGRLPRRLWWPLHKVAAVSFVLIWTHGVLAGSDTVALLAVYLVTGSAVLGVATSRYLARTPVERAELRR
jgi:predicted ferric reductase